MIKAVSLFLTTLAAMVTLGCGDSLPAARATTSHTSQFCSSLKPIVQEWQRIPSIVADVSSATLAKTKREQLAAASVILRTTTSLKVQLRSAPASVRRAFNWDVSDEKRFKSVEDATTPAQVKLAARSRVSSLAREGPFIIYILSRCEGHSVPAPERRIGGLPPRPPGIRQYALVPDEGFTEFRSVRDIPPGISVGRRVVVTGMAGAGKSTFSRALSAKTGLPVIHLDVHFWKPGWVEPSEDEWREKQRGLLTGDEWIARRQLPRHTRPSA